MTLCMIFYFYLSVSFIYCIFAAEIKGNDMTATAKRLQSTPMAPYMDVMRSLDVDDMHLVVEFMNEKIREAEETKRKAEDEFLARKMAEVEISPRIAKLIEDTRLTAEEAKDERTRYILGLDR